MNSGEVIQNKQVLKKAKQELIQLSFQLQEKAIQEKFCLNQYNTLCNLLIK